jgi:hypothetical protein
MFASPFQKATKNYVEIEYRRGVTAGEYAFAKVKFGSLKRKQLESVLCSMHQMTQDVPQIPTHTQTAVRTGYRKVPVEVGYVSE